jgi:hypothetical protein
VVYDYSTPVMGPPGVSLSPEFDLGTVLGAVGSSGTACLRFVGIKVSDAFALVAEDTVNAVATPATGTFVPQDSPGWAVTFTSITAAPTGPVKVATGCLATP